MALLPPPRATSTNFSQCSKKAPACPGLFCTIIISMKPRRLSEAGLTIVEILVAIAVAAIVTVSLNTVVTSYLHLSQRGRYLNLANSFVEAKVEALRNSGFNSINVGTSSLNSQLPSQLPPSRSATMVVTSPSADIKKIDISVTYRDQGQDNTYHYATYIGELGVGQ
jgi:hypothetical protein